MRAQYICVSERIFRYHIIDNERTISVLIYRQAECISWNARDSLHDREGMTRERYDDSLRAFRRVSSICASIYEKRLAIMKYRFHRISPYDHRFVLRFLLTLSEISIISLSEWIHEQSQDEEGECSHYRIVPYISHHPSHPHHNDQ